MKKIVITGGAGFIGSHLALACCQLPSQPQVVVVDNLRTGRRENLARLQAYSNFHWLEASILQEDALDQACLQADCIFHLAAMVSVPESMRSPRECVELNVNGTLCLLEAARRHGVGRLVFSSSAAVYGDEPELPKHEGMRPAPLSPYGITKLDGEYYLEMYRREHGLSTCSLRYFNVYGAGQDPKSHYAAAVPIFVERAKLGQPLTIFGDGHQTRDFVYVEDVVAANLWMASRPELSGAFNVATGTTVTILELAQTLCSLLQSRSPIEHAAPRLGDIRDSWSDPRRLFATGFRPRFDLQQGLSQSLPSWVS